MTDPERTQLDENVVKTDDDRTIASDDVTLMPPGDAPTSLDSRTIPLPSAAPESSTTLPLPGDLPTVAKARPDTQADHPPTVALPTVAPPRMQRQTIDETLATPDQPPAAGQSTERDIGVSDPPAAELSGTLLDAHLVAGASAEMTAAVPPLAGRPTGPARPASDAPSTIARPQAMKTGKFARVTLPKVPGYEILSELGRGGMGVVYKARQLGLNRVVALKMVLSAGRASQDELARFRAEAEAVAYLHHPNIVQVYEVKDFEGLPYFSLEFCPGGTLADRVGGRPQPPRLAARIIRDLARAIHHAHQRNILHRDLKPANVLLTLPDVHAEATAVRNTDRRTQKAPGDAPPIATQDKPTEPAARGSRSAIQRLTGIFQNPSEGDLEHCIPKITDFGLAKRLEGDVGQTRDGSVMGTPSYMAPEQARGKVRELGPPADVYALGAILYDLLTGNPPFRGDTVMDTLHQVIHREPVAPRIVHAKIPADLNTICLKCLEKEPAKRYASADALAEDLRRFLDQEPILARPGPWWERVGKWAKRRPAAAAAAAMFALFVAAIGIGGYVLAQREAANARRETERAAEEAGLRAEAVTEKQKADSQRQRAETLQAEAEAQSRREVVLKNVAVAAKETAERQRKRADELRNLAEEHFRKACAAVDTLLARIGHERLAHEPRMEQIRRELLEKAASFYEGFLRERGDDPSVRWQTARTQKNLGDIQEMLGNIDQAESRYRAALALFADLLKSTPDVRHYRRDRAATEQNLGQLLSESGRSEEAERAFKNARDLRLALLKEDPTAEARADLAASDHALGLLLERRGDAAGARSAFVAALELQKQVAESVSGEERGVTVWREVARSENSLGRIAEAAGQAKEAETRYQNALAILARLVAAAPKMPEQRQELGQTYDNLGRLRRDREPAAALKDYEQAVAVAEKLSEDFPATPAYRQDLAAALNNLAVLRLAAGQRQQADEAFAKALTLKERLAAEIHWVADFRRDFGAGLNNRGIQLRTEDRSEEADKAFHRAVQVLTDLVTEHPDTPDYQRELARTLVNRALVRQAERQTDEAEALLQKALAVQEKLVARRDVLPEFRSELLRTRIALGALFQVRAAAAAGRRQTSASEELTRAETEYRAAREGYKQLSATYPNEPDYRYQQALATSALAGLSGARGQSADARNQWGEAAELLATLAKRHPEVSGYRLDLGRVYNDRALNCAMAGARQEAGDLWVKASTLLADLVKQHPKDLAARQELAKVENNRAVLALKANRLAEATAAYRRVVEVLDTLPDGVRTGPDYRHSVMAGHRELAEQLSATGEPAREVDAEWRRALDLSRALVKEVPANARYASESAIVAHKLGQRLLLANRPADARPYLEEAVASEREALKLAPSAVYKTLLGQHLNVLKEILYQLDDHAAMAAVVGEMLGAKPADAPARVAAAADFARCASIARSDKKLVESQRRETAQNYADRAMTELKEAVKAGFNDNKELNQKKFDILRERVDFQEMLKTLE